MILEVNSWQSEDLEGMHDIYYGTALPPHRKPIPLEHVQDRIGETALRCDPDRIVAVVRTHGPDRNSPFTPIDATSERIAGHLIDFLKPTHVSDIWTIESKTLSDLYIGFNQIDLPQYTSYEMLRQQLLMAIHEGGEGFAFS